MDTSEHNKRTAGSDQPARDSVQGEPKNIFDAFRNIDEGRNGATPPLASTFTYTSTSTSTSTSASAANSYQKGRIKKSSRGGVAVHMGDSKSRVTPLYESMMSVISTVGVKAEIANSTRSSKRLKSK